MPASGEIPDFIYDIPEPPEMMTIFLQLQPTLQVQVCHLSLIKHHLEEADARCNCK